MDRLSAAWPLLRDVIIVVTALGLIIYEAVFYGGEVRQNLILAYVGLLASPVFLRRDDRSHTEAPEKADPPAPREAER